MKQLKLLFLALFVLLAACSQQTPAPTHTKSVVSMALGTQTFSYTGGPQTWAVPAGVTQVTLDVFGAQGGYETAEGGKGGRATATITVTPGETFTIVVGGMGHSPWLGDGALGGFNGGGNGGAPYSLPAVYYGSGGGGASDVRIGGTDLAHRVIVAGGGGGAAAVFGPNGPAFGGAGGGLTGGTGNSAYIPYAPSGGAGGNQDGTTGSGQLGLGSNGANNTSTLFNGVGSGGGGGGYYGGAGGSAGTGGGGGSGFGPAGTVFETGVRTGDGIVTLTYTPPDPTPPVASPTQSPAANGAGWNNSDVTVNWNWSDEAGGSGIDSANCTTTSTSSGEGTLTLTATCKDNAGNTGNASHVVKVDKTAPTLNPVVTPNPVFLNGSASVTSGAADALSGLASQSCGTLSTSTVGTQSVTCNATDNAGNTNSKPVNYEVVYNFSGFFQPVDNLPTLNLVKAGSSIPIKFSLNGNKGLNVLAAGYPASQTIACSSSAPLDDIEQTVTAGNSSLSYDAASDTYTYVWKTEKGWAGTCRQLNLKLSDGSSHLTNFKFK